MALSWIAVVAYSGAVVSVATALFVLLAAPRRPTNRALAALVLLVGANAGVYLLQAILSDRRIAYNLALTGSVFQLASIPVYLLFLGYALDTPLVRPLRARAGRVVLILATLAAMAIPYVAPQFFFDEPRDSWGGVLLTFTPQAGDRWANVGTVFTSLFAVVAAAHAMVRSPRGTARHDYARVYFSAFIVLDVALILSEILNVASTAGMRNVVSATRTIGSIDTQLLLFGVVYPVGAIVFAFLLTRALVRRQLFDFDLKVKWTIRRGALVGVFVAAFFVVSAIAQQYLQQYGVLLGGAAVGILLFVARPIERAADRLADKAMPRTQPTPGYVHFKKLDVYRAAVESALETGGIDTRERQMLDKLRAKLALGIDDTLALEEDVLQGIRGGETAARLPA